MIQHRLATDELYQWISISGRILGTLFYYSPNDEKVQSILPLFKQEDWQWGELALEQDIRTNLQHHEALDEHYQDLFIGPNELAAPPWGSVYLDKDSVFFGDSTLALQEFMQAHHIQLISNLNEPADHIGLLLMLAAYLAENKRDLLSGFLEEHLFSWCYRYLDLLSEQRQYPFYCALAALTQKTVKDWQRQFAITTPQRKLYR